jgi:protein-arginine kinase
MSSAALNKKNTKSKKEIFEDYLKLHDLESLISEMTNSVVHSLDPNPIVYMIKYLTGLLTEEERAEYNINIDPPYPKGVPIVKFPNYKCTNILSNYLTKNNWYDYKYIKTSFNNDINKLTHLSEYSKTDKIGIAIVDKDCLNAFKSLLDKIIYDIHDINEYKKSCNILYKIGNSPKLQKDNFYFSNGLRNYIKSLKFWFSRNIEGYTYNNIDKRNGKLKEEIEKFIINLKNEGILPEDLNKVNDIENFMEEELDIKKEYKWMNEAGFINRNYTLNERGIWANDDNSLIILINFANHFEIISTIRNCDGDKIQDNYNYIMDILKQTKVKFSFDVFPKYGYVNSQVSLLGGGFKITGVFKIKNIKKIENILKNFDFNEYEIKEKEELFKFTKEYHLCEKDILTFFYRIIINSFGIKTLCDNYNNININFNKITDFKNIDNPLIMAYIHTFEKLKYEINVNGNNINELFEYYKTTENEEDFLFTNKYCYNIYNQLIYKYFYYKSDIQLEITNYMEKPEEPRDISDIDTHDYINNIDNINIYIFRNIKDYPFPVDKQYNQYNEKSLKLVKKVLANLNKRSKIGDFFDFNEKTLSTIENYNIKIFHKDIMTKYNLDNDFPQNRGFIKFLHPHIYATINDINHINFILSNNHPSEKDDLREDMENLINTINRFSREIKFAFDDKFGFLTTCPKFMGNGIKISVDIKFKKIKEEFLNKYTEDKNMTWSVIDKKKDGNVIIRFENKSSYNQSETEMLCNWLFYINEIINDYL